MAKHIFMGIDLGTTGCKIILLREDGEVIDSETVDYAILTPVPGFAEQVPSDWWNGLCKITNDLLARNPELAKNIIGIGICGQMHTQVYLDSRNQILRNAITWMDQRSQNVVQDILKNPGNAESIFENTGNFLSTTYTAPHIAWVKQHEPEVYRKTAKILLAKDFIKFKLTGEMVTDFSDAAGTLLFNVTNKNWSAEMFGLFGIKQGLLPDVAKSDLMIGRVTLEASRQTGIPAGIPVINGCADHTATALGAGIVRSGQAAVIIGTAGVVSVCLDRPLPDPRRRVLCWNYCLENRWVNLGVMQTAGESLNWFRQNFDGDSGKDVFQIYHEELKGIPDGSEGVIFLPYLMGERTPYWNPDARGVFFGLGLHHSKYHFIKAIMEGVCFGLKNNLQTIESLGIQVDELRLLGGGSNSLVWKNCLAQILNKNILTVKVKESGALGSSLLCGLALGIYSSLDSAVAELIQTEEPLLYPELSAVYRKNFEIFLRLYEQVKDLYQKPGA